MIKHNIKSVLKRPFLKRDKCIYVQNNIFPKFVDEPVYLNVYYKDIKEKVELIENDGEKLVIKRDYLNRKDFYILNTIVEMEIYPSVYEFLKVMKIYKPYYIHFQFVPSNKWTVNFNCCFEFNTKLTDLNYFDLKPEKITFNKETIEIRFENEQTGIYFIY